jgi:hypothetical protein
VIANPALTELLAATEAARLLNQRTALFIAWIDRTMAVARTTNYDPVEMDKMLAECPSNNEAGYV